MIFRLGNWGLTAYQYPTACSRECDSLVRPKAPTPGTSLTNPQTTTTTNPHKRHTRLRPPPRPPKITTRRPSSLPPPPPSPSRIRRSLLRPPTTVLQRPKPRVLLRFRATSGVLSRSRSLWSRTAAEDYGALDGSAGEFRVQEEPGEF